MMTKEKTALIEKMEKQRFLPITEETLSLYQSYNEMIDRHDPDELSYLLFYEGEYFFRLGDFEQSLNHLTRCLQAPKSEELRYLDAYSYISIGLIYCHLNQETIAINYLLQAKALSEKLGCKRQYIVCCINLGLIYSRLEVYDTALNYYDEALSHINAVADVANLAIPTHAYRGILFCKNKDYEKALDASIQAESLMDKSPATFYTAPVFCLKIYLCGMHEDIALLRQTLNQLLSLASSDTDFLELSDCIFDVYEYLLGKEMNDECALILDHIEPYCMSSPLFFLRQSYLKHRISYCEHFNLSDEYLDACNRMISLRPRYQDEQNQAKLFSLEYIERLHQTKCDSEIFREKSRIDQMTGLLNKYTIQFLIEEDLSKATPLKQSALILVDLDHFKQINDTLGHLAGDSFICQTASIIQNYFKDNALCGRVGGDEFLIYISDVTDRSFIILQAEILRQEIFRQTSERNITITTQASIGIAFSSEYCYNFEGLFQAADKALYRAKLEGRNKVIVAK